MPHQDFYMGKRHNQEVPENLMISVIIPIYHGKKYIEEQIAQIEKAASYFSAHSQKSKKEIELLFINDAPDDPIEKEYSSELIDIKVVNSEVNRGIHGARVYGISLAKGEYIHFLDQDDEISPRFYSSQLETIGDADLVYCRGYNGRQEIYNEDRCFEKSSYRDEILKRPPMISVGQALLRKNSIPSIWLSSILQNNGSDDYYLWLSYVSEKETFAQNQNLLFRHTRVGGNFSSDIVRARKSDEEMVHILIEEGSFTQIEKAMLEELPERLINNRYKYLLKEQQFFVALESLIWNKNAGYGLSDYLEYEEIGSILIYGAGMLGQSMMELLIHSNVEIRGFIDRNAKYISVNIPIFSLENLPNNMTADAVIITVLDGDEKIKSILENSHLEERGIRILLLREVLENLERKNFSWASLKSI